MKQPGEEKERLSEQRSLLPTKPKNKNEKEKTCSPSPVCALVIRRSMSVALLRFLCSTIFSFKPPIAIKGPSMSIESYSMALLNLKCTAITPTSKTHHRHDSPESNFERKKDQSDDRNQNPNQNKTLPFSGSRGREI